MSSTLLFLCHESYCNLLNKEITCKIIPFFRESDGSCKHVSCLLFALVDFNDRRTDKNAEVGTDLQCQWTKARKVSQPVKVEQLDYRKNRTKPKKPGPTPDVYKPLNKADNNLILKVQQDIKQVYTFFFSLFFSQQ